MGSSFEFYHVMKSLEMKFGRIRTYVLSVKEKQPIQQSTRGPTAYTD